MAVATTRVRLGTAVTAVARRRPWKLAREVVTLDHLSGGRAVLGVGLGDPEDDGFRRVSEVHDLRLRAARLDEALEIVTGLWRGDEISFHGAHFRLDNVRFLPMSAQPDGIPIWVGGGWPGPAVRRAARYHGFMPYPRHPANPYQDADDPIPPADVAAMVARVESLRDNLDGFDIVIGGRRRRADWEAERDHIAAVAGAGATWWCEWVPPGSADEMRAAAGREPLRSR
jgi:alkanesulfonate monooxygenase SsuD/methylene tetrahydromethanopterin reductase-like flavin-dependent oxidoreductase (luciferase family)